MFESIVVWFLMESFVVADMVEVELAIDKEEFDPVDELRFV